jgi:zinc/manganese transport system substrate-binding protein
VADHVDTLAVSTAAGDEGPGDGHDGEGDNPHIWFDPTRVSIAVGPLADELVEVGVDRDAVLRCLADYREQLAELDARVEEILAPVAPGDRLLVTNHDSLVYFADRYGFEVIGTIIPAASTLAEANPAQLEELAQLVEDLDVPAVFAETQTSTADAEALADRVGGVEVVTLHTGTLAGPGSGAESYPQLLVTDAELIAAALAGGTG